MRITSQKKDPKEKGLWIFGIGKHLIGYPPSPPGPIPLCFFLFISLSLSCHSLTRHIFFLFLQSHSISVFQVFSLLFSHTCHSINQRGETGKGGERGEGERSREEEREERERRKVRERGREEGEMNASSYNLSQLILRAFHPKPPYFPSQNEDQKAVPQWLRTWTHVREVCWFESSVGPLPLASA